MIPTPATVKTLYTGRSLLHWIILTAGLVFAVLWFLSVVGSGFSSPDWVAPTAVLCIAVALWIP